MIDTILFGLKNLVEVSYILTVRERDKIPVQLRTISYDFCFIVVHNLMIVMYVWFHGFVVSFVRVYIYIYIYNDLNVGIMNPGIG